MTDVKPLLPLIRTKLHRPPLAADHILRPKLLERLDRHRGRPLTLLCAPAGYGKSTLVSSWLERNAVPWAWLSLDDNDNDLHLFLSYFLAALQTVLPDVGLKTQAMLKSSELPQPGYIAQHLINEIDQAGRPFIFVLDDYHLVEAAPVHELVSELLNHAPRPMHLVVATRREPALPLAALRARGLMSEIGIRDLRFSTTEIREFLRKLLGSPVDAAAAAVLEERAEGWVTGIRLAALSLGHVEDLVQAASRMPGDNRHVVDYLVGEILSKQTPAIEELLMATSVLDRFCAPLCDAVRCPPGSPAAEVLSGESFLRHLESHNLFVIPLDDRGRWFRYHHLFQHLLKARLKKRLSQAQIWGIHRKAASWFEENGWLEEALLHLLQCGDCIEAGRMILRHRNELLNQENWQRLDAWLRKIPGDVLENDAGLQLLRAWSLDNRLRLEESWSAVDRAERLVAHLPPESAESGRLQGEIEALRSRQRYEDARGDLALQHARRALAGLPPECLSERGFALVIMAGAFHMSGDAGQAQKLLHDHLGSGARQAGIFQARLLAALCYLHWLEIDLPALAMAAGQYLALGQETGLQETLAAGRYFLGIAKYQTNDLDEAERLLSSLVTDQTLPVSTNAFVQSAFALASLYQAKGMPGRAVEVARTAAELMLKFRNAHQLMNALAFQADLTLKQGRTAEAVAWARHYDPEPLRPMYRFYSPQITLAKVLMAEGTQESRLRAAALLGRLSDFLTRTHNRRFLVEVLALEALMSDAQGNPQAADKALARAIQIALPGGALRLFVDLGPAIARLIGRLNLKADALTYAGRIVGALKREQEVDSQLVTPPAAASGGLAHGLEFLDPLSKREREILALLAQRLSNREIAERLFVAPKTVKVHLYNIYQKLRVNTRRQAVEKALALGMLEARAP